MIDIEKYIAQTEYVPDLKVDMGYIISNDFYYGPENGWSEDDWKNKREVLEKPSIALYGQYALSEDFWGNEDQLLSYYRSVLIAAKKHNKERKAGDNCYWLRPIVYKKGLNSISFPWYDTFVEGLPFLEALATNRQGLIFDDLDQGWQVAVFSEKDKFHFIERDWEEDKAHWLVSCNREIVSDMARQAIERTKKQIEFLTSNIGTDLWTKRNR